MRCRPLSMFSGVWDPCRPPRKTAVGSTPSARNPEQALAGAKQAALPHHIDHVQIPPSFLARCASVALAARGRFPLLLAPGFRRLFQGAPAPPPAPVPPPAAPRVSRGGVRARPACRCRAAQQHRVALHQVDRGRLRRVGDLPGDRLRLDAAFIGDPVAELRKVPQTFEVLVVACAAARSRCFSRRLAVIPTNSANCGRLAHQLAQGAQALLPAVNKRRFFTMCSPRLMVPYALIH